MCANNKSNEQVLCSCIVTSVAWFLVGKEVHWRTIVASSILFFRSPIMVMVRQFYKWISAIAMLVNNVMQFTAGFTRTTIHHLLQIWRALQRSVWSFKRVPHWNHLINYWLYYPKSGNRLSCSVFFFYVCAEFIINR